MSNFVAFRFVDYDFQLPLRRAIDYVAANTSRALDAKSLRVYVLRALNVFESLRSIDEQEKDPKNYVDYFDLLLTVIEVNSLTELAETFEGYVFDRVKPSVFYYCGRK